ncbi:MAG: NAD-dependent deacylase [Chitinophagales bacterium]
MKNVVILTGAGISAESGLKTFRDSNGLWEDHRVEDVASPEGWLRDPQLVLHFYNQRRRHLLQANPNKAHIALAALEKKYHVAIITQNVDDLHERAGSSSVLHLHGELLKVRSTKNEQDVMEWRKDLNLGDTCAAGSQLRPHIVWFGEPVPLIDKAAATVREADVFIVIGTSLQVYPAAGLIHYCKYECPKYLIDPAAKSIRGIPNLTVMEQAATVAVPELVNQLLTERT